MIVRRPPRRSGNIVFVSLIAIFALLVLYTLQVNSARLTIRKVGVQSAADATAHAAGLELTRAMNAITALNHLIGELNAFSAMVMSFGGVGLEEFRSTGKYHHLPNGKLKRAHNAAVRYGNLVRKVVGYDRVKTENSKSDAAIGKSRERLKQVMSWAYWIHAAGGILATEPVLHQFKGVGVRLVQAAVEIEKNVEFEWKVLDDMEQIAENVLLPLKQLCNSLIIPKLYEYAMKWVDEAGQRAEEAARVIAREHGGAEGSLFPSVAGGGKQPLALPVEAEQMQRGAATHVRSQMVRAMTPWVQYWRKPILSYGRQILPLSQFARNYHNSSNEFTLHLAYWQWDEIHFDHSTRLYRLIDLDVAGADKGLEPWTKVEGSSRADQLFGVLGFAHQPSPDPLTPTLYPQTQPDGMVGVAQVMLYNANPHLGRQRDKWQPTVGFDTLNWAEEVPEFEFGLRYDSGREIRQPRIQLNWQVKLVPVTRLAEATGTQTAPINRILERTTTDRAIANLH